jgi:hypothetical protein
MAKINNDLLDGARGAIGKQLVFRERGGQTFVSKYPDMRNVEPSEKQLKEKGRFGDAVRFAQSIIYDPAQKAVYKVAKGKSVYHTAIKDYMAKNK